MLKFALQMVEELYGNEKAKAVMRMLFVDWHKISKACMGGKKIHAVSAAG